MENTNKKEKKAIFQGRQLTLVLIIIAIVVIMTIIKGNHFLSRSNLETILVGSSYDLLLACGMTFVLMLGGIDLSVGSVLAFVGVVVTLLLQNGVSVVLAIVAGLLIASAIGACNGVLIAKFNTSPFVTTLSSMSIFRGLCYVLTSGYFVNKLPSSYLSLGRGSVLGIPNIIIIPIVIAIIFGILLTRHKLFKQMFYVGSNPDAAYLSGISSPKIIILGYMLCSTMAGVSAILMTSRLAMGYAGFGIAAEMRAIAAAVIGGASMHGGEGSLIGTALGVLLVALINNVFIMVNGSPNWQGAISGIILLVAVTIDLLRTNKIVGED